MGLIKTRNKDWKFILNSNKGKHICKYNPLDFENTEHGLERDNDGLYFTYSGEYTYLKDSYDYLKEGLDDYGILWICTLTIKNRNNHTQEYDTLLDAKKLDFSSIVETSDNGKTIKIPLADSGFLEKIKARENEEIPYGRLETLDGDTITPFTDEYKEVEIYGQEIISSGIGDFEIMQLNVPDVGFVDYIFPTIEWESNNKEVVKTLLYGNCDGTNFDSSIFSYYADGVAAKVNVKLILSYYYNTVSSAGPISTFSIKKAKKITDGTLNYHNKNIDILTISTLWSQSITGIAATDVYNNIDMEQEFDIGGDYGLYFQFSRIEGSCLGGAMTVSSNTETALTIIEKYPVTDINHVPLFQVHERLIESITGQSESFVSSVFDTGGKYAHIMASNGYLYRQFSTTKAQLTFKWKELTENLIKVLGLGYGLIEEDGVKKIICEDKSYFYDETVGNVIKKIKRESFTKELDIDDFYSAIISGTPKQKYEQESGLTSYATQSEYTTVLSTMDNKLDLATKYQIDGNWHEFTRRLKKTETETTDSKYDNDICLMETIIDGSDLIQRTDEDFDAVNGIDDITTPINLNLTPTRAIYRYGSSLRIGLDKYLSSYIKFNKSEILTELSTVRSDESVTVYENKDLNPNLFDDPLLTGYVVKCLADISLEFIAAIEADPYKKIQIPNDIDGGVVQGWIKSLSTQPIGESLTNLELYEATSVSTADDSIVWVDGIAISWNSGDNIDWNY